MTEIPKDSCPFCHSRAFSITEYQIDTYKTDIYGKLHEYHENSHFALGRCIQCGKEFRMFIGRTKFIPLSGIRPYLKEYSESLPTFSYMCKLTPSNNPMQIQERDDDNEAKRGGESSV